MEWKFIVHAEDGYVEAVSRGVADSDGSLEMAKALGETMRANRISKALIDHRNVDYIIANTAGFNNRPSVLPAAAVPLKIKIAEIIRPEHSGHFKFLETIFDSLGYKLATFHETEKAMTWLLVAD